MGVDLRPYRLLDSHRSISLSLYNFGTTLRTTCVHEHIWRSQGHAVPTSDHTAVSRSHRGDSGSRRSASPFRPHRRVAVVQRRSQLQPTVPPVVQHVCVAVNYCRCLRSLGHWSGVGEDSRAHRRLRNWSVLSSFRLFARHSWLDGGKDERLSVAEPRIGGSRRSSSWNGPARVISDIPHSSRCETTNRHALCGGSSRPEAILRLPSRRGRGSKVAAASFSATAARYIATRQLARRSTGDNVFTEFPRVLDGGAACRVIEDTPHLLRSRLVEGSSECRNGLLVVA